jgi:uroporphyrinogen decarboxylase
MMYSEPDAFHRLSEKLAATVAAFLTAQIEAGASAVQLFDSWAGHLSLADYETFALPHTKSVFERVSGAATIHYVGNGAHLVEAAASAGSEAMSVDWRTDIPAARRLTNGRVAFQGNLDPCVLLGPRDGVVAKTREMLKRCAGEPGYVANLGHGILPEVPVENARAFIETVQEWGPK